MNTNNSVNDKRAPSASHFQCQLFPLFIVSSLNVVYIEKDGKGDR